MNTAVMFSRATDEWATPQAFFDNLNAEFEFALDAAATLENRKTSLYCGPGAMGGCADGLAVSWAFITDRGRLGACWLNPPYSRCREFIAKAALEAQRGATVVCLVPARVDTRWFHEHIYDSAERSYRPGVDVRFVKGRLKFGNSQNSAPFPSMVVVFRPVGARAEEGRRRSD
jgi:site-specific DNA-methyltransferase (adenine-specific)